MTEIKRWISSRKELRKPDGKDREIMAVYILLAICIMLGAAAVALGVVMYRKMTGGRSEVTVDDIREENFRLKEAIDNSIKMNNSMLVGALNAQNENSVQQQNRFDRFMLAVDQKLDSMRQETFRSMNDVKAANAANLTEVRNDNARNLAEIKKETAAHLDRVRADNERQLEKMRETVDEKLSSTLEQRFTQSFKLVNDRLEEINRTFGELQNLQTGVSDLNRIFKNVKTRGTWGEVALESLLAQILVPEQYEKQVRLTRGSDDAVDFAIKMPGKGDGEVLLPIDAKFPIEDYERLVDASERADSEGVESAGKALAARIKQEAMSIRDKYIKPPKTTDFAIMYLPTEGLYAEVIKRDGLVEDIQNRHRVVVCGPTTIAALLNSLQMGFKSVAIEKRSTEIGKLLTVFVADFNKFSKLLRQTGDKLDSVRSTLSKAEERSGLIEKKLNKVHTLTGEEPLQLEDGIDAEIGFDNEEDII